jgi:Eukaryotic translation initiation factor 3 subunit 8 N-terminus
LQGQPPRAYIRGLAALEDALSGVSRADTKKMSQNNARAVTRIKMAFKKLQEKPGFTAAMEAFRANPDAPDDDEVTAAIAARKAAAGEDDSDEEEVIIGREFE